MLWRLRKGNPTPSPSDNEVIDSAPVTALNNDTALAELVALKGLEVLDTPKIRIRCFGHIINLVTRALLFPREEHLLRILMLRISIGGGSLDQLAAYIILWSGYIARSWQLTTYVISRGSLAVRRSFMWSLIMLPGGSQFYPVPEPTPLPPPPSRTLSLANDGESDSECIETTRRGIKFSASDITRLKYDSTVAEFNNWLQDLKSAFDSDPAKFPESRQKVILASMTMDSQLKTTYNSTVGVYPAISTHWRKFKRWARDTVLHGDSDRQKLSKEFTTARQRLDEDPNQFYLRLLNLGTLSGRTVDTEEYRTRLVMPLQNLINQQDRLYATVQDVVAHAGRLWQTLTPGKI